MKKRVCHVTSAHGRYDVRIFQKECRSLAANGYEVYLIVNDSQNNEIIDGVHIVSTKFRPSSRVRRFFFSQAKIKKKIREIDAEIYHLHDPDLLPLGNALVRKNKKVIFDSHEDVPEQIKDKEWLPRYLRKIVSGVYCWYEKYSLKKYGAVISVTPHIVKRLRKYNKETIMITNYPILEKRSIDRSPKRKICFAGGIDAQWNHDKIIEAVGQMDDIAYALAGSGSKQYLDYLKTLDGWKKVEYYGKISFAEVQSIYADSMIGIALNYTGQVRGIGTLGNTKIFEYMEARLPIICTDYILWKEIVDKNRCGIAINPHNISGIVKTIQYLLDNPEKAAEMGRNGREAVEREYNWETQVQKLLDLYNLMVR